MIATQCSNSYEVKLFAVKNCKYFPTKIRGKKYQQKQKAEHYFSGIPSA